MINTIFCAFAESLLKLHLGPNDLTEKIVDTIIYYTIHQNLCRLDVIVAHNFV